MAQWEPKIIKDLIRDLTRILITIVLLTSSIVVIFGNYPDDYRKWAFGMIGAIFGYWLR